jgi:hypothetical protein
MSMCSECPYPKNKASNLCGNLCLLNVLPGVSLLDGYLIHNMEIRS